VCHASENGAEETVTAVTVRSFVGIRLVKCLHNLYRLELRRVRNVTITKSMIFNEKLHDQRDFYDRCRIKVKHTLLKCVKT